jgi:hypothetical protein
VSLASPDSPDAGPPTPEAPELAVPRPGPPVPTPDPGVTAAEEATARLNGLPGRPVAEHVEEYEAVHRALQGALATIDEG